MSSKLDLPLFLFIYLLLPLADAEFDNTSNMSTVLVTLSLRPAGRWRMYVSLNFGVGTLDNGVSVIIWPSVIEDLLRCDNFVVSLHIVLPAADYITRNHLTPTKEIHNLAGITSHLTGQRCS